MAYYITKPASIDPSITLYFKGDNADGFSDDPSGKVTYETEEKQTQKQILMEKWCIYFGSTVVSE